MSSVSSSPRPFPVLRPCFVLLLLLGLALAPAAARAADGDGDGVDDAIDSCRELAHPNQADGDGDGFGAPCDCDFDNDGYCTIGDFVAFLPDFVAGADAGSGTDMSGDGFVNIADFNLFLPGFIAGAPGPGALGGSDVAARYEGVQCDGLAPNDACQILLAPGIVLDVLREQIAEIADGLEVTGTIEIGTEDGWLTLLTGSLVIEPGPGPFGFDTVRGSAVLSNDLGGWFGDMALDLVEVDVGFDLGANIVADVPLQPDLHYLLFLARAGLELELGGGVVLEGPGVATTLLFNPSDPFFYMGAQVTNIPVVTPSGPFVLSGGGGSGYSRQGLIPFVPATTDGIAALFPNFDGHTVSWMSGAMPTCFGCPAATVEGYAITDLDPQEDGLAVFGPEPNEDYRVGLNGTFGIEGTVGLLTLQLDLFDATGGWSHLDEGFAVFMGGRIQWREDLFETNTPIAFGLEPAVGQEIGLGVMFGPGPYDDFFRFESRKLTIDPSDVSASVGVGVAIFQSEEFYFQTGEAGTFLGGRTTAQSVVDGVTALEESEMELTFPSVGDGELILRSRFQIGQEQLRESTLWIGPTRIAQEGLYDMPNYTFRMLGEITPEGPYLEGSLEVPIPYHYPAVEAVLALANEIDQYQAEIATLQQLAGGQLAAVTAAQDAVDVQQDVYDGLYAALTAARNALDDHDERRAAVQRRDCGCDCGRFDAICWGACGICVAAKEAELLYLDGKRSALVTAVNGARTLVLGASGLLGQYQLALALAESALQLTQSSLDDAIGALAALYDQRDQLPAEDGVFDAIITLALDEEDLTGSVGGDFQGVPVGTGIVYTDENPRACFVPPVPGATEEFCTPL